jgi:hypothetical protein
MEWEGDEGNELVSTWSCNPVSMRWKPSSSCHIQLHNTVRRGIAIISYVCLIHISRWCNSELHGGLLASCSHVQKYFRTHVSWHHGKGQANFLRRKLMKMQMVDDETYGETWTLSKTWRTMNPWWDYISYKIDVSKVLDANLNFLQILVMSHWVEQSYRYWSLQQYSAEATIRHLEPIWRRVAIPPITISTTSHRYSH